MDDCFDWLLLSKFMENLTTQQWLWSQTSWIKKTTYPWQNLHVVKSILCLQGWFASVVSNKAATCHRIKTHIFNITAIVLTIYYMPAQRSLLVRPIKLQACLDFHPDRQSFAVNEWLKIVFICISNWPLLCGGFWLRSLNTFISYTTPYGSNSSRSCSSDQDRGIWPTNILMASTSGWSGWSKDPFIFFPLKIT